MWHGPFGIMWTSYLSTPAMSICMRYCPFKTQLPFFLCDTGPVVKSSGLPRKLLHGSPVAQKHRLMTSSGRHRPGQKMYPPLESLEAWSSRATNAILHEQLNFLKRVSLCHVISCYYLKVGCKLVGTSDPAPWAVLCLSAILSVVFYAPRLDIVLPSLLFFLHQLTCSYSTHSAFKSCWFLPCPKISKNSKNFSSDMRGWWLKISSCEGIVTSRLYHEEQERSHILETIQFFENTLCTPWSLCMESMAYRDAADRSQTHETPVTVRRWSYYRFQIARAGSKNQQLIWRLLHLAQLGFLRLICDLQMRCGKQNCRIPIRKRVRLDQSVLIGQACSDSTCANRFFLARVQNRFGNQSMETLDFPHQSCHASSNELVNVKKQFWLTICKHCSRHKLCILESVYIHAPPASAILNT